jgi:hypothetical protein
MNKYIVVFIAILAMVFLAGATKTTTKRYPAQTGTYKVDKHKSSGKKGVGGICFIGSSQF